MLAISIMSRKYDEVIDGWQVYSQKLCVVIIE